MVFRHWDTYRTTPAGTGASVVTDSSRRVTSPFSGPLRQGRVNVTENNLEPCEEVKES